MKQIAIVGCGPGAPEYMTGVALKAIAGAEVYAGSAQLLKSFALAGRFQIQIASDIQGALQSIATCVAAGKRVAVLVSGDPGLCSLATPVIQRFGLAACEVIPGISSVQLVFARLGLEWFEARILSAHHTLPELGAEELMPCKTLVILCGHQLSQQWVSALFFSLGQGRKLVVCQDLSLPTEQITEVDGQQFCKMKLSSRTIVVIRSS